MNVFKLVRESLQPLQFQRGLDPKEAMGIGKRAKIKAWLDEMGVRNYTINDDYTIDVNGNVWLNNKNLDKFPSYIQFGKVKGYFRCDNNQLTTLEGAPKSVGGGFYCHNNQLTTLEGAPKSVGGGFLCNDNQLTTLEGAPKSVGGGFYCYNNQLTTLEGAPKYVEWNFHCYNNDKKFTKEEVRSVCDVQGTII